MSETTVRMPCRQIVLNAVMELHQQGVPAVIESIQQLTGLHRERINESIKLLKEEELIYSAVRGVYVPAELYPAPRAVSLTMVPGGVSKLEIGDICVDVWPREIQAIRFLLAGTGAPYPLGPMEDGLVVRRKK
jgi:predicted transcriptional regulator